MRSPVWTSAMVNGRMPKLAAVGDVIETPRTCASGTHSRCMFREKTLFIFCAVPGEIFAQIMHICFHSCKFFIYAELHYTNLLI